MAGPSIPDGFDFTDPDLYVHRVPAAEFAELRRAAPVWWNPQPRGASGFDDEGYWVVTKHADVLEVSRDSELYSSQRKTAIIRHAQQVTEDSLAMQRLIMLNLDPPLHTKVRAIVSRGFTPRAIGRLRETLAGRAANIVKTALTAGTGDIVTDVVNAELDGGELTSDEFGFFVILLAVAGNETTRNAISHGMLAFLDHPDQWELFRAERPGTAADEIVRWATPVTVFQRTAVGDTILGGQRIRAGQRVGLFYRSANFDEEVFDAPERFDILRSPNPHLGFGGTGTHYCLGANLAQLEIDLMFNAIADGMPGIRRAGDAARLRSGWLNGIKRLPVSYR